VSQLTTSRLVILTATVAVLAAGAGYGAGRSAAPGDTDAVQEEADAYDAALIAAHREAAASSRSEGHDEGLANGKRAGATAGRFAGNSAGSTAAASELAATQAAEVEASPPPAAEELVPCEAYNGLCTPEQLEAFLETGEDGTPNPTPP
jgi:hypothetical protein